MKSGYLILALGLSLLMLAGCATPARRIQQNPQLFASFPPEAQAKIKQGQIEVGYTKDMVAMALGRPQRIVTRTTQAGPAEFWVYTDVAYSSHFEPVGTGYWYRDRMGRTHWADDRSWLGVQHRHETVVLRVEFEGERVKVIEEVH